MPSAFSQPAVVAGPRAGAPGSLIAPGRTVTWAVGDAWGDVRVSEAASASAVLTAAVLLAAVLTAAGPPATGPTAAAAAATAVAAAVPTARVILAR
jgi:hypothetical protein